MYMRLYFVLLLISSVLAGKKFRVTLISASRCALIKGAVDSSEPVTYEISVQRVNPKNSLIRANYVILRPVGPVMMNFRIYELKQNEQPMFKLEKVDCHSPFTYQLLRVVNLKVDTNCMAVPGNYTTSNINLQDFAWIIGKSVVSPGKYMYELEFYSPKGIAVCNHVVCDIQMKK